MERVLVKGKAVVDPLSKMGDTGTVLQEADGTVWSVMLTLSDVSFGVKGHNKFYAIQIIIDDKATHKAYVFYKWGRIGAKNPQRKLMGPMTKDAAKENFVAKFQLKTENAWPLTGDFQPVAGRYTLIELDYTDDKEEDEETPSQDNDIPPSTLPPSVQDFVKMVCDIDLIEQEMAEMHLDLKRMPLGKLSKQQIDKGYGILDQISETLNTMTALSSEKQEDDPKEQVTARRRSGRKKSLPSKAKQELNKCRARIKELSSEFYTLVPHDFGMNLPPLIDSVWELKLKLDLLEVLSDVEITQKLVKEKKAVDTNPIDAHYASFNTHMEYVDPSTEEYKNIAEYIALTHAPTHRQYKLKVESIHRVSRADEAAKSDIFDSVANHQLLWHGSRLANIASILTKGLRIAPPEAPSTGYMFGKGVYFADVASKSANYCWATTKQTKGVLMLTEVALGKSHEVLEAEEFNYDSVKAKGCESVFGVGRMTPSTETHLIKNGVKMPKGTLEPTDAEGTLLYNEYVVYRTEQPGMSNSPSVDGIAYMIMPHEAELLVEQIKLTELESLASKEWMKYHGDIEKLNLQAHQSAKQKADNFVIEALLTFKKLDVLVRNLLSIELWKEKVFPSMTDFSDTASLRTYFVLYHEAVLCNLLEVAFYHEHVLESLDDDIFLEVIDYAMRKITWLLSTPRDVFKNKTTFHKSGQDVVKLLDSSSRREELDRQRLEIEFRISIQCVTIMRYICERVKILPLNLLTRLLDKHDVLLSFVALIENPPWTFKSTTNNGETQWKKFFEQKWSIVDPCDLLQLTTTEAQPWIGIYFLLCSKESRDQYQLTSFRKNELLRVRKYLNDVLLDQLPLLADVQRFLDELAIVQIPHTQILSQTRLVMEALPVLRSALLRKYKNDFISLGNQFLTACNQLNRQDDMQCLAEVYNMHGIEELLDGEPAPQEVEKPSAPLEQTKPEQPVLLHYPTQVEITFSAPTTQKIVEIGMDEEVHFDCQVQLETEKIVDTPQGFYFRFNLDKIKPSAKVPLHACIDASISFSNETKCRLICSDISLEAPVNDKSLIAWRQAGNLEEGNGILQVQFKWIAEDECFQVGSLFLSVPETPSNQRQM